MEYTKLYELLYSNRALLRKFEETQDGDPDNHLYNEYYNLMPNDLVRLAHSIDPKSGQEPLGHQLWLAVKIMAKEEEANKLKEELTNKETVEPKRIKI